MSDDLPFLPLSELSRMLARSETSSRADRRGVSRAHRRVRSSPARFRRGLPRRRARSGRRGRPRPAGRLRARSARGTADRAEGPLPHRRPPDHRRLEELARSHLRSHGDGGGTPRGRGNDPARQDAHGRIRVRRLGSQPADGRALESMGQRDAPCRRRLVERLRGRGGGGPVPRRNRLGHRRIDPHPRGALRPHRIEAHLRPREPLRRRAAVRHARLDRSARAHRRGRRAAHRRDVRARSARSCDARRAARRPRSGPCRRGRHSRHAHHRPRAGSLSRVHAARGDSRVRGQRSSRCASWARASTQHPSRSISRT